MRQERRLELRVLGSFEALVDGEPVRLGRRPRTLLAALALRRGGSASTDSLIDAVWDGSPPASARSVLHVYVSQLRRALPDERLVTEQSGYRLAIGKDEVDADTFERLVSDGRHASAEGRLRRAAGDFAAALELWRGEALADLDGVLFVRDEAARLNELRLACLEDRFDVELRLGRHVEVAADLERLVAGHPLRERLRGQLMTALYRGGRQADALAAYREGRQLLVSELGLEPGSELRELERRILGQDTTLAAPVQEAPRRLRVPLPHTRTIGRDLELAEIATLLLDSRTRLVMLTGPGGIGKTRLAIELANAVGDRLADGAVLVDLAPLGDFEQLLPTIGRTLGLREGDATGWLELLGAQLADQELLLVLDNMEHLVEGAAVLSPLFDAAPRVTMLATSRRRLRLSAEHVVEVRPLEVADARMLLASRVAAAGVTVDVEEAVATELVERLDGMPLAIELAAPWFRRLGPTELLSLLESRLAVLNDGPRDAPARQQTMRSTIDWGFDLLDPGARHLLGRLSLFRRSFDAAAASEVGGLTETAAALDELVESSMVLRAGVGGADTAVAGGEAFGLLEVVREYAQALPSADREGRELHARHFLELAESAEPGLVGPEQGRWLEQLEGSHDDLRAALDWLGADPDTSLQLRLASALGRFWYIRGYLTEGLERLQRGVTDAGGAHPELTANALRSASALAVLRGDYGQARELVERALDLYRKLGDALGVVRALSNLGAIQHGLGELDAAASTLDECIAAAEELDERRPLALARNNRGDLALTQGDLEIARTEFELSLVLLREADDVTNVARSLYNLGAVALRQERFDDARRLLVEALDLSESLDDKEDIAWCLIALASIGAGAGRLDDAAVVLGFARALLERINATSKPNELQLSEGTHERLASALGRQALDELLVSGSHAATADAIALARSLGA